MTFNSLILHTHAHTHIIKHAGLYICMYTLIFPLNGKIALYIIFCLISIPFKALFQSEYSTSSILLVLED